MILDAILLGIDSKAIDALFPNPASCQIALQALLMTL